MSDGTLTKIKGAREVVNQSINIDGMASSKWSAVEGKEGLEPRVLTLCNSGIQCKRV